MEVATFFASFIKPLTSSVFKECAKILKCDEELQKLIDAHEKVKAVLDNCDKSKTQINDSPASAKWLQELGCYRYDIEDFVNDLHEHRLSFESHLFRRIRKRITTPRKIVKLREKLENMCDFIGVLLAARQNNSMQPQEEEEVPGVNLLSDNTPLVYGTRRDEDKRSIIRKLRSTSSLKGHCGVSIVGMDGLGKSALARMIAADESIKSEFSLILCAHVSGRFRLGDVVRKLAASEEDTTRSHHQRDRVLQDLLPGKKVLIILDDLWSVTTVEDWENFKHNFLSLSEYWKILATTRNPNVAEKTETTPYHLKIMEDADCVRLIKETANLSESDQTLYVKEVTDIAEKCKGLPLVATHFGLTLSRKQSERELDDTIQRFMNCTNLMELPEFQEVLPRLMLNNPQLPPHLNSCYAYCSLFLPGHKFQRDHLIQFWEVEGLVQPELSGSQCFDEMLSRSILQPLESSNEQQLDYDIHDFNLQFVKNPASKVILRIDELKEEIISTLTSYRHLSLPSQNINDPLLEQTKNCKSLRTFLLLHPNKPTTLDFSYSTFRKLERLRLLGLSHTNILFSIGSKPLKHLRYLDLSSSVIQTLPDPICPLFPVLQVLKLNYCSKLKKLPKDLNRLISLKHLHVNMPILPGQPTMLGMLTNLECLDSYAVGKDEGNKVAELRNMEHLREVCISNLERVNSLVEAGESMLKEKQMLSKLTLEWDSSVTQILNAANVLEGLEPGNGLKDLTIRKYPNPEFPVWLTSTSRRLLSIYLVDCDGCKALPPLGQLPLLKTLVLESFENLEIVDRAIIGQEETAGFPRLESIEFRKMVKLRRWDGIREGDMPCLRNLRIIECPILVYLCPLNHQAGLTNLQIKTCPILKSLPKLSPSFKVEGGKVTIEDSPLIDGKVYILFVSNSFDSYKVKFNKYDYLQI